jgi:hypothetical protein
MIATIGARLAAAPTELPKTEITKHMQSCAVDTHNKSFERFYELPATSQMLKTRYRKHY